MKPTAETQILEYIVELEARRDEVIIEASGSVDAGVTRAGLAAALREAAILAEVIGELRAMVEER